ncbi:MAG TPA: fibrobacter succinogenes major paralogous domain-containing protein [Prolixibacteraceae bacterium]|nr:fibrobacter succinogenes major paralogous domain-containing protein [Prolixibacteraceae bacterium]
MKIKSGIYSLVVMVMLVILASSCSKTVTNDPIPNGSTVTDIDGNVYKTVTIGTQVWMAENLKTTKYRNGDPIPNITDATAWTNLTTGAYCNNNNDANYATTYGRLYNWYAVNDIRNIAPAGWHIPTKAEWTTLTTYLGGQGVAGIKLKESGTMHWINTNTDVTNESGFAALPGGMRCYNSYIITPIYKFQTPGSDGLWWSSSEFNTNLAWFLILSGYPGFNIDYEFDDGGGKKDGLSIRCIKD